MKEVIRVLHVVGGMVQGGTENFLMNIYRNIDRTKVQFDFLVNREGVFDEEIKALGGKIYYISALQKVGQRKYVNNLDEFFKEHKEYKIIHSHINQVSGLILERAKKAKIPIRIAHSHNNKYGKNCFVNIYKMFLGTKLEKNANYKFACSKEAGRFLFGKKADFKVINNAIDSSKFEFNAKTREKVRKQFGINKNTFVIGNVGRLCFQKNPIFLIKIFNEFVKINKDSKLLMIGKGNLKNKVLRYISKYNIENKVIILEDRKDVNELMQAMDFFVLPSHFEGLGIVLIEAQASGLRCITSKGVVAEEAKITDLLEFYPLNKTPKDWAKEVYKNKNYKRMDIIDKIKQKKYDVKEIAKDMENMYMNF